MYAIDKVSRPVEAILANNLLAGVRLNQIEVTKNADGRKQSSVIATTKLVFTDFFLQFTPAVLGQQFAKIAMEKRNGAYCQCLFAPLDSILPDGSIRTFGPAENKILSKIIHRGWTENSVLPSKTDNTRNGRDRQNEFALFKNSARFVEIMCEKYKNGETPDETAWHEAGITTMCQIAEETGNQYLIDYIEHIAAHRKQFDTSHGLPHLAKGHKSYGLLPTPLITSAAATLTDLESKSQKRPSIITAELVKGLRDTENGMPIIVNGRHQRDEHGRSVSRSKRMDSKDEIDVYAEGQAALSPFELEEFEIDVHERRKLEDKKPWQQPSGDIDVDFAPQYVSSRWAQAVKEARRATTRDAMRD